MGPNESKQMEMLLEEGGIADDGATVDPVSGNEVPPGSMAKEVRDDVPAQLSEGEYVVPADVVRFFGVKFFEDLRAEAKGGLSAMEANGRIGGEPVSQTMDNQADGELTAEELSVLQELGMAVGGMVPQTPNNMYQQPSPVAMGNTGGYNSGDKVLYAAEGADVSTSNVDPYTAQFTRGMGSSFAPGFLVDDVLSPQEEPTEVVTLYGPNGEVEAIILPSQQARYDELIEAGYSTDQVEVTTETDVGREEPDGGGRDDGTTTDPSSDVNGGFDVNSISSDNLAATARGLNAISGIANAVSAITGTPIGALASTQTVAMYNDVIARMTEEGIEHNFEPRGSLFGGEESLYGGLGDTDGNGTVGFGDTALGDFLGFDGKVGLQGPSFKDSWGGARRGATNTGSTNTGGTNTGGTNTGGNEGRGGNEAAGVDGPAPGASAPGDAPGVSAGPTGASSGAASSAAAGSGHEGNADPDAGGSMLNTGGLIKRRSKKKNK
jgi:hypothetical protein